MSAWVQQKSLMSAPRAVRAVRAATLLLGLALAAPYGVALAQGSGDAAATPLSREQVKRDRDEFIKTHRWDAGTETWVLKPGVEAPAGMKTRAQIRSERDEFLRNNRYDSATETWVPIKAEKRTASKTREQVRQETRQFMRTHEWDAATEAWVAKPSSKK